MAERQKRAGTAEATARSTAEADAASTKEKSSPRKTVGQMSLMSMTFKKYPGQQQVDLSASGPQRQHTAPTTSVALQCLRGPIRLMPSWCGTGEDGGFLNDV